MEEELNILFNSTQDALLLMKVDGDSFRYILNNRSHQKLTGLSLAFLKGKTPTEVLGNELGKKQERYCKECIITRKTVTFEDEFEFKGEKITLLTKFTPMFKSEDETYIVGSRVDITHLKKSIDSSRQLVEKFDAMFRFHTAIMLLINPEDGCIIDANPSASDFYGYSIEELRTLNIHDLNTLDKDEVRELYLLAQEKSQKYFLFPHRLKSGEIRMVDVYSSPIEYGEKRVLYSIIFDVTERESAKHELFHEKELLNIMFDSMGDGVIATDDSGKITRINKATRDITLRNADELIGSNLSDFFIESGLQSLTEQGILINSRGEKIPIAHNIAPIKDPTGDYYGKVVVFRNIDKEIKEKEKILYLSNHDALTGLYNRRVFDDVWSRLDHKKKYPIGIIMGDVNGLKITNDVFGHELGDLLLITVSNKIKENISDEDIAIRWGGDEFVILLPNTNQNEINGILDNIKKSLSEKKLNDILEMSISFGYAIKTEKVQKPDALLQEAEEMMYRRKLLDGKTLRSTLVNTVIWLLDNNRLETKEHLSRIENYCLKLGQKMKLGEESLNELCLLSKFHDIGKIGVEENILTKQKALNEEEWEEIRRHPEIGYRITVNIPELSSIAESILCHHERWDGSGYPKGLIGKEIPLFSRIFAVADAYDVMIHDQIYKQAVSSETAKEELKKQSGVQFDPQIVDLFLMLL